MYINIQLDASSGQRRQNLVKPGGKQMGSTPKKRRKETEEEERASPKEQQEMEYGKSRNRVWYQGH
jgi:hypothetical protein